MKLILALAIQLTISKLAITIISFFNLYYSFPFFVEFDKPTPTMHTLQL